MDLTEAQALIRESTKGYIDWGNFAHGLRTSFGSFEVRFLLILLLLLLLAGINIYYRKKAKNQNNKQVNKEDTIENRAEKSGLFNRPPRKKDLFKFSADSFLWRHRFLLVNIFILSVVFFLFSISFIIKPQVISTTPREGEYMESGAQVIELEFDVPIDEDEIEFNISPVVAGRWSVESASPYSPFKRVVKFYPEESIFPGNEVVIYLVGIRQWWASSKLHEQAIEFKSPRIPEVAELSISDNAENVPVNEEIILAYDAPVGDFVDIRVESDPEVEYQLVNKDKSTQALKFSSNLEQDQQYKIDIYRTPKSFNVKTGEVLVQGESTVIKSLNFKTVTTPFIEAFEPKGDVVLTDSEVKISFDQTMDRESVESKFSIEPVVMGTFSWQDDKNFIFKPDQPLNKDTKYIVKLGVGVASSAAGVIGEELVQEFKTIGPVKASITYPVNGTAGHNPSTTSVVVQFDQEVDKESAQSSFSISPYAQGTFSWEGNQMTYHTAGNLNYSTRYNINVSPGVKTVHGLDSTEQFSSYFVTKDNVFSLTVPWYKQQENFTCNIAATRMVLAYHGINVTESTVKNAVGIGTDPNQNWVPGYGVHVGPIANYISQYRPVTIKTGWNVPEMMHEIEKGHLVILWWYNRYSKPYGAFTLSSGVTGYTGMHSEIARGFIGDPNNPSHILTNDPWRGLLTYKRSDFEAAWSYLGNTALIVE